MSSFEEPAITASMSISDTQSVATTLETSDIPERHARALRIWLSIVALLVIAMILVGGATRLTDSGLSITEWQPIVGAIPPLSQADWQEAFDAYKQIPEYALVNKGMDLESFKTIYWWEWAHRFLGRFIGLVFFVPFVAFWLSGFIPRPLLPHLIGLFVLGGLQGVLGWYMVKSGLVDRVDVSQYRLAAHFGVAVLILGYTSWLILSLGPPKQERAISRTPAIVGGLVLLLVFLQLLSGAFVAGIDGGMGFNTWPLMNGALIPSGLGAAEPWYLNPFENPLTVQFDHRMLGYVLVLATVLQAWWLARRPGGTYLRGSAIALASLCLLQVALGIWTLLSFVPIELGLAHQAGAIVVFTAALYHFWRCMAGEPRRGSHTVASA
ncbi:MAG: COX15/CtaA family protein [Pseudomonadota bacterium]